MIRHVRLRNWRSYDSLDVDFAPGTTFVVAPNGVGKTSLVHALAWALFGEHARSISPKDCIRAGTEQATVEISMTLRDGSTLAIERNIKRRGSPTSTYRLNEEELDPGAAQDLVESEFGIDLPTAARLSVMLGGGHVASDRALDIETHLHQAFGVTNLLRASELADGALKDAQKATKGLRASDKQRVADRATVEADIARLQGDVVGAEATGTRLEAGLAVADQARQLAAEWARFRTVANMFQDALVDIAKEVREVLADEQVPSDADRVVLQEMLAQARVTITDRTEETIGKLDHARAATIAAEHGLELLEGDHTTCPTCLRPIDRDAVAVARAAHYELAERAHREESELSRAAATATAQLERINSLVARLEVLSQPQGPQSDEHQDPEFAERVYREALDALNSHNATLGGLRSQIDALRQQLDADNEVQQAQRRLTEAFRREGVAAAAAAALRTATEQLTSTRIEPIAREVQWRWKQLFNDGGLQLRPDGAVTRFVAGEELGWDSLSGGERIWARLITHLLVIECSTTLPFVWFDEPLEHLDPKLRRTVAGYLADASAAHAPEQIIVTTYEHALASQLANDHPQAHILHIRRS
ncbi:MAG: AAA family ATPase [Acidimicrobiia bacterium]|nr:AAA family ATPase [Acidimicrobiia bacterium]